MHRYHLGRRFLTSFLSGRRSVLRELNSRHFGERGYSMVELLVAMLFTTILMAGMQKVFQSSVSTFYTTGEKVSSARRNRMAMDLLYEDINMAGMFIGDLTSPPQDLGSDNPPFFILPRQEIPDYLVDGQKQYADQLFFYMDQALPFIGTLQTGSSTYTNELGIARDGGAAPEDQTYKVDCGKPAYAALVASAWENGNLHMSFMDQWQVVKLGNVSEPSSENGILTVTMAQDPLAAVMGRGPTASQPFQHLAGSSVMFYVPRQMVRYSIQMLQLDPGSTAGIPCLVRDQGNYDPAAFVPALQQQVVTENVTALRVFLSANPGYLSVNAPNQAWAPFSEIGVNPTFSEGWTNGILANFNTQLVSSGRSGTGGTQSAAIMQGNYANGLAWFRVIPAVLRLDITTQTASQRAEYSTNGRTLARANYTQSLIIVPRNFGLPLE